MPRPPRFLRVLASLPFFVLPSQTALSPDGKLVIWQGVESPLEGHPETSRIFFADSRKSLSFDNLKRRVLGTSLPPSVRPLTRADEDAVDPSFSPDGRWIAFRSARGPHAFLQVWGLSLSGGEGIPLTDAPSNVLDYEWTPNGSLVYVVEDPPSIWIVGGVLPGLPAPADSSSPRDPALLFEGDESLASIALSFDGKRAAFFARERAADTGEVDLHVLDFASREVRVAARRPGNETSPVWAFDHSEIFFLAPAEPPSAASSAVAGGTSSTASSAADPLPFRILRVPSEGGEATPATRRLELPVLELRSCRDSDRLFAIAEDGEHTRLVRIRPWEGSHEILVHEEGRLRDLTVRRDGERVFCVYEAPGKGPEIASWTFPDEELVLQTALNREASAP